MRNYHRVSKYIQATADLMREGKRKGINSQQSHHGQVISAQLVRPCDNRDFHNPLPQLVTVPLISPWRKLSPHFFLVKWTACKAV